MAERRASPNLNGRRRHSIEQRPRDAQDDSASLTTSRYRSESPDVDDLVGVRLSLAGLKPSADTDLSRQSSKHSSSACDDELLDELHSDPYSSVIERLRLQLGDCLPAVDEEMVSKAVIYAFSTDPPSRESEPIDKYQVEVELLRETQQWAHQHRRGRDESAEQDFLQECLNKVFLHIHQHHLSSCKHALRIFTSIATILQLEIADSVDVPRDTLLLQGIPRFTKRESLRQFLERSGPIKAVAISKANPGFAYCRFREEASVNKVIASDHGSIAFGGSLIQAALIGEGSLFYYQSSTESPANSLADQTGEVEEELQISPVCVARHSSMQEQEKHFRRTSSVSLVSSRPSPLPFLQ